MKTLSLLALLVVSGCVTTHVTVPPNVRAQLSRELVGTERFLKLSCYATPFFGDDTKKLLTAVQPDEVRLLETVGGRPISPGPSERVLPAGARVRILQVEYPTPVAVTGRVLLTPRERVWVYLDVEGTPKGSPPLVLVLDPKISDERDFRAALDRYLTADDPTPTLLTFGDLIREAVAKKNAVLDMSEEALEMAWGYPESRVLTWEGDRKRETWTWPGAKRVAVLLDGRVKELK